MASFEAVVFNFRKQPRNVFRWVFDFAQIVVVVFLVGHVYQLIDNQLADIGSGGIGALVLPVTAPWLCGFLYYSLSSRLTTLAVSLHAPHSFFEVWKKNFSWYYFSILGAVLAALTQIAVHPRHG